MDNGGKNIGEAIGAILLGIVGGIALAAVLKYFSHPKCPVCHNQIQAGVSPCPFCCTALRWV